MTTPQSLSQPDRPPSQSTIFATLDSYPWSTDPDFQSGLSSILSSSSNSDPSQTEYLTLRARCFYYAQKTSLPVDFAAYQDWRTHRRAQEPSPDKIDRGSHRKNGADEAKGENGADLSRHVMRRSDEQQPSAPYPTTFGRIVELIGSGQPIPGIKDVPDTVLQGQASQASAERRRKPWERGDSRIQAATDR